MTIIVSGKTYQVKDEKEARALANGRTFLIKDGIFIRAVFNSVDVETIVRNSGKAKDNKKRG